MVRRYTGFRPDGAPETPEEYLAVSQARMAVAFCVLFGVWLATLIVALW